VKTNVGFSMGIPEFHVYDAILESNFVGALPRKYVERSVLSLDIGPDAEIFCFTKERAQVSNWALSK